MPDLKGSELNPATQREALSRFVHRFTRDHKPRWARSPMADGSAYPVQFASDADWLANTTFRVRKDGGLDSRSGFCVSSPTWPDNPELRRTA